MTLKRGYVSFSKLKIAANVSYFLQKNCNLLRICELWSSLYRPTFRRVIIIVVGINDGKVGLGIGTSKQNDFTFSKEK